MPIVNVLVALVLAGLILWAVGQFPLDGTIVRLIRVVVIVAVVLYLLPWFIALFQAGIAGLRR